MYRIYLIWKKFVCSQVLHSHLYYGKEAPCPPLQLYYNCIRGRRLPAPLYNCITIVLGEGGSLPPSTIVLGEGGPFPPSPIADRHSWLTAAFYKFVTLV